MHTTQPRTAGAHQLNTSSAHAETSFTFRPHEKDLLIELPRGVDRGDAAGLLDAGVCGAALPGSCSENVGRPPAGVDGALGPPLFCGLCFCCLRVNEKARFTLCEREVRCT